ncbi:hypothetical protein Tco_0633622 [Tanacetum coccineum]
MMCVKNDQYILATQSYTTFYLEDMARRPLGWKVIEHVNHKKFSNGGVIVVEDDPDVIHVDNSSDLALSTSLNDLKIKALHIDGQSIDVDAPPDIIDVVDEDGDIIDEEDPIPHDLADSDDEDLINLDIDDGMSADVARGHGGDGGGDDRPPSHHIPTGCGGCLGNRGKGTRKPNLGGRRAGRQHTLQEIRNLGLKAITDKSGPISIRFEFGDRETLMPLGEHAAHWANYLRELIRELPLHYPSWLQVPAEQKAGVMAQTGNIYKRSTMARRLLLRKGIGFLTQRENLRLEASTITSFSHFRGSIGMPDCEEMLRLQGLGSNTKTGVPYTEDEIMTIVGGGKQRGHIPSVGKGLCLVREQSFHSSPPCTHSSDVVKLKKREKVLTRQWEWRAHGDDEDDGEDGKDEDDS